MGDTNTTVLRPDSVEVDTALAGVGDVPGGEQSAAESKRNPGAAPTNGELSAARALNVATEAINLVNQVARDAAQHINELKGRIRLLEDVLCARLGMSRFELLEQEGAIHLQKTVLAYQGKNNEFPEIEFSQRITLTGKDLFKEAN